METLMSHYLNGIKEGFWTKMLRDEGSSLENEKGNPVLHPAVTGKVYVFKENNVLEELEGVHFSNIDLKFYTSDGDLHEAYEKYKGRKWSLKFKMVDNRDQWGNPHILEGMFLSPLLLGENGSLDWKNLIEMSKKEIELAVQVGALKPENDQFMPRFYAGNPVAFVLCNSPDASLEDIRPYVTFLTLVLFWDEYIDNPSLFGRRLKFSELCELRSKLMEVFAGTKLPEEQEVSFDFPALKPCCRYAYLIRQWLKKRTSSCEIYERYLVDWMEYLNANATAQSAEWYALESECETGTFARAKEMIRPYDACTFITLSSQLYSYKTELPVEIHHDHLYKEAQKKTCQAIALANDIVSCWKDYYNGEKNNAVLNLHRLQNMDYVAAFKEVLRQTNELTVHVVQLEKCLLELYGDEKNLKHALFLLKSQIIGDCQYYSFAQRYGQITYDAVIHMENESWKECASKMLPE